jgi:acyl dehydratase
MHADIFSERGMIMAKPIAKLIYKELVEGDEAPSISHQITRTDLVTYAGASGDFNPMHTDEVAAKKAGLPGVFGHGMLSMGLLARAITDWAGVGNLSEYRVRFTKQTWPGETLTSKIVVTEKHESDGGKLILADVSLINQDGEVKLMGSAKVVAA